MRTWPALVVSGLDDVPSADDLASSFRQTGAGSGSSRADADFTRADALQAALIDYSVAAIDDSSPNWRVYFHDAAERDRAAGSLRHAFPDLQFRPLDVPDEDWAARSQANLKAVQVGHIVVAPPWDARGSGSPGAVTIVIRPSMGFGTGHHATTRLCLAALQQANVRGKSVLDVGTGSGVLAIAASRLGASPAIGIDDDGDAIQSARENLELNPGTAADLRIGDLRTSTLGVADVVLANLTGTLLVQVAPQLTELVAPNGRLIVSGLMQHEEADVVRAFASLRVLDRTQEDEWVCLVMTREGIFQ